MKYVALLRGINVGGKSMIKMSDLKTCFLDNGYTNVSTYINSGNVIFESKEKNIDQIRNTIEKALAKKFKLELKVVVRSETEIQKILDEVPTEWKKENKLRCYITFMREPLTPNTALKEVQPKEDIDSISIGHHVLYMSTSLSGLTKSGFTKLTATKIYKDITIRNYTTVKKLSSLIKGN